MDTPTVSGQGLLSDLWSTGHSVTDLYYALKTSQLIKTLQNPVSY